MTTVGIITEYNPFHYGHAYQLQEARRQHQAETVVVLMSGNVVQRGEFAIVDKWTRAQAAIQYGADLVLELPLIASLQSADYFAEWGVRLLDALEVDAMAFGTESATEGDLYRYNTAIENHLDAIDESVRQALSQGDSYAASYQHAVEQCLDSSLYSFNPSLANHQLGIQYIRQIKRLGNTIHPLVIPRVQEYGASRMPVHSATSIRREWLEEGIQLSLVPDLTHSIYQGIPLVQMADYFPLLDYQLSVMSINDLSNLHDISDGFETYVQSGHSIRASYHEFVTQLVTRRWARATIQRKLMTILLHINEDEWQAASDAMEKEPACRVLAVSSGGQHYLKRMRYQRRIELFTNMRERHEAQYRLNLRADAVYQRNPLREIPEQNHGRYVLR